MEDSRKKLMLCSDERLCFKRTAAGYPDNSRKSKASKQKCDDTKGTLEKRKESRAQEERSVGVFD